ncbi:hypothetical protein E2C01_102048 [Portunus trituberculatus]|uniref:Uncharacterized protein n=1 Tax=Portunus trituberculatus TaxID=210409 RepID=A0A5B7KLN6_PORTR|nr:hypothetical protein [Portunus trituberculatus]
MSTSRLEIIHDSHDPNHVQERCDGGNGDTPSRRHLAAQPMSVYPLVLQPITSLGTEPRQEGKFKVKRK